MASRETGGKVQCLSGARSSVGSPVCLERGWMDLGRAVTVLWDEASIITALLTAEVLAAAVPTCPGWTVADLVRHLGVVHRWARHAVLVGPDGHFQGPADDEQIRQWFGDGAAALIATLAEPNPRGP